VRKRVTPGWRISRLCWAGCRRLVWTAALDGKRHGYVAEIVTEDGGHDGDTEPAGSVHRRKNAGGGTVRPVIDQRYSLDQVREVLQYLAAGHAQGK
jgi:hypothetical protein